MVSAPQRTEKQYRASEKIDVCKDFDWCKWKEMKKSTIVYIKLKARKTGENVEATRAKIEAVKAQRPEDGNIAFYQYGEKIKVAGGVVIKKRPKHRLERLRQKNN